MNGEIDELEAERLKQILFPRKTRASRSSISSSLESQKENKEINFNKTSNIKDQIAKLKQGIQQFMQRQGLTEHHLSTPRECLELIKFMSEGMVNYYDEIQEAASNLLDSVPKPLAKAMPKSKYFLIALKLSFWQSLYSKKRKRVISQTLHLIKQQSSVQQKEILDYHKRQIKQTNKIQIAVSAKLNHAFNRWRINSALLHKDLVEKYFQADNHSHVANFLHVIPNESKTVLYLQKLLHNVTNADNIEILLYDFSSNLLRGYKSGNEHLASVFQSVYNNTHRSCAGRVEAEIDDAESLSVNNQTNVKRIQLRLQHSLTKICITKKQTLAVSEMKRDLDYVGQVDDFTIFHGQSARPNLGGCIFTPIIGKNGCIAVIRQYFYGKIGERPKAETISLITQILEASIRTSTILDKMKEKSQLIRNKYFLKSVLILNSLEKSEPSSFFSLIQKFFHLHHLGQYEFNLTNTLDYLPHITIKNHKGHVGEGGRSKIITAISKMTQNGSKYLYDNGLFYLIAEDKVFEFKVSNQSEIKVQGLQKLKVLQEILQKMELIRVENQKQKERLLIQQQKRKQQAQNIKIFQTKKEIMSFCLQKREIKSEKELLNICSQFLSKFSNQKQSQLRVQLINKTIAPGKKSQKCNGVILYQDDRIKLVLSQKQEQSKETILAEHVKDYFKGWAQTLVQNMNKPHLVPAIVKSSMKSEIYFQNQNLSQAFMSLLQDVFTIQRHQIKLIRTQLNPFTDENYHYFISTKDINLQSHESFIKSLKNYAIGSSNSFDPISTIIHINQLFIVIDKYLAIQEDHITKLSEIYRKWEQHNLKKEVFHITIKKNQAYIKTFQKIDCIYKAKLNKLFCQIKNSANQVKFIPNLLSNYIFRQKKMHFNTFFSILKTKNQVKSLSKWSQMLKGIQTIVNSIYKISSIKDLFINDKISKEKEKKLAKFSLIILNHQNTLLNSAFNQIYLSKFIFNTNKISILLQLQNKTISPAFQLIKRQSKAKQSLSMVQSETQCSAFSKMDSVIRMGKLIKEKFSIFTLFLCLKNGSYLQISSESFEIHHQFFYKTGFQYFEFNSQSKSEIRNLIWLVPESYTVTLFEKHYLQVLSRAIQEGFAKFIYKNQEFLSLLNSFVLAKSRKLLHKALKNLRTFSISKVKNQEYQLRERYYEASIQVQNFTLMEKQQAKQQQQRIEQTAQALKLKEKLQANLNQFRKSIIRLQISSRKYEEGQAKQRIERQRRQARQAFTFWRVQAAFRTKYAQRRALARKKQAFACNNLLKFLKVKVQDTLKYCHQRITVQSANFRVREINSKKQKEILKENELNHNQNRLLTFQDELNQQMEDQAYKKQISIIPISFKHFESSKKQNIEVTDDDMRKANAGAYKLNAKTLKFLKRMGKLNN